jgi:hypothetical protein
LLNFNAAIDGMGASEFGNGFAVVPSEAKLSPGNPDRAVDGPGWGAVAILV